MSHPDEHLTAPLFTGYFQGHSSMLCRLHDTLEVFDTDAQAIGEIPTPYWRNWKPKVETFEFHYSIVVKYVHKSK